MASDAAISRVLDASPPPDLDAYVGAGGGRGWERARSLPPDDIIVTLFASGLRGRGGAGFPTGRKWQTVAAYESAVYPTTVVVNGAEGEPGSFKDRMLLRTNPYRVIEGALIAARAVDATRVIVAMKRDFTQVRARVDAAIAEIRGASWLDGIELDSFGGPDAYLYGEETGLLEVLDGREPFPRVAPPWRHGVDEIGDGTESAAELELAEPGGAGIAPPTLVNNSETLANVPLILSEGAEWFRAFGTEESPGTVLCTVSGATVRAGVAEVPMGTTLRSVIEQIGGGVDPGREIVAVLSGVANALIPARALDTPLTYEAMRAAGSGLGAAGFVVIDDRTDLVAVTHGVSRFLAVESCGQCTPCKRDGLELSALLDRIRRSEANGFDVDSVADRTATVADGARCTLAQQHQVVVDSLLELFPDAIRAHGDGRAPAAEPYLVAPIADIVNGRAVLDAAVARRQPDWTYNDTDSGRWPAARIDERSAETTED
ncbi:MAG: NADH-ubiquinone oxidoreductase-F iron-sulfur binding region domain-containing protein [Acidimicrobiia bacterium]